MNILLGVTGSVAANLTPKITKALQEFGEVKIVFTKNGIYFINNLDFLYSVDRVPQTYWDENEWYKNIQMGSYNLAAGGKIWQKKGDPVVHIDLREWAQVLIIAPLTANTLAKIVNGTCDNLLTSVVCAWDDTKPVILAPSMNSYMWENRITQKNLNTAKIELGMHVVPPQKKMLACGTMGEGALAEIDDIVEKVKDKTRCMFPLYSHGYCSGIPVGNHPGAFGVKRKHSHHTGVDLYTKDGEIVCAMENGRVINKEAFTGPKDGSDWWNDTDALIVAGAHNICYGEIEINHNMYVGRKVYKGEIIGRVKRVLKEGKERPDIPGHSCSMLHIELYDNSRKECSTTWALDKPKHDYLLDPTSLLIDAAGGTEKQLTL